jgi:hypothetical protein
VWLAPAPCSPLVAEDRLGASDTTTIQQPSTTDQPIQQLSTTTNIYKSNSTNFIRFQQHLNQFRQIPQPSPTRPSLISYLSDNYNHIFLSYINTFNQPNTHPMHPTTHLIHISQMHNHFDKKKNLLNLALQTQNN